MRAQAFNNSIKSSKTAYCSRPVLFSLARRGAQHQCAAVSGMKQPAPAAADGSAAVTLSDIRANLIRQEDTIIFNILERAQFAQNKPVYQPGAVPVPALSDGRGPVSLLEYVLRETEQVHGRVRRYTSPDEHAFYPADLPTLLLPPLSYPAVLAPCASSINFNDSIMSTYIDDILPAIAAPGDDANYGSAATLDVLCLQALSKRIHYGKWVAEAKFRAQPEAYTSLIRANDAKGLMTLLTDEAVERKVSQRVRLKAATFGQDIAGADAAGEGPLKYKVNPDIVAQLYERIIMPMTKEVQVAYLLRRLD